MSAEEHISALKAKHAELELMLQDEVNHAHPNDVVIADIKKQKLRIKDELAQLGA